MSAQVKSIGYCKHHLVFKMRAKPSGADQLATNARKMVVWYNQIPNVGWSVVSFAPLVYFCYQFMPLPWMYSFLGLSLLSGLLPARFFRALQLSRDLALYYRVGIRTFRKYTQDGDLINRFIRKKHPRYRVADTPLSLRKQIVKAHYIEKIHFMMLVFFLFASLYALAQGYIVWALVISVINSVYNLYPIFLQQYNRLRMQQLLHRYPENKLTNT